MCSERLETSEVSSVRWQHRFDEICHIMFDILMRHTSIFSQTIFVFLTPPSPLPRNTVCQRCPSRKMMSSQGKAAD